MSDFTLWLRDETRQTESRTPLMPEGAKELISRGIDVVVERSTRRIIPDQAYVDAGCSLVNPGEWINAPKNAVILGLKELPATPAALRHTHVYFAHAYKRQSGWRKLLSRFVAGSGTLLDLEYMVTPEGRRVAAFGYWAGYMGAALSLIQWYDRTTGVPSALDEGLAPFANAAAMDEFINSRKTVADKPRVLIIGANGRSGQGAADICRHHGMVPTLWGRNETMLLDRRKILDHDILVNCVFVDRDIAPFVRPHDLTENTRLGVISDVSCDPLSKFNPLPLYRKPTSWQQPFLTIDQNGANVDLIAIDNLPALLPRESSIEFSSLLLPYLKTLGAQGHDPVWQATEQAFRKACREKDAHRFQSSHQQQHVV